jgi:signal-transduction protein with cAMP-binding, CBS, and nucleotidyltransferase domain
VIIESTRGAPEGIVTEWDYLAKIIAESRDPRKVKLGEIMTSDLVSVDANDGLDQVAQIMTQRGIRRVLVMKKDEILGVITAKTMLSRLKEYIDRVSSQIARLQTPNVLEELFKTGKTDPESIDRKPRKTEFFLHADHIKTG